MMPRTGHTHIYKVVIIISNRYIMHISLLSIMDVILSVGGCQVSAKLILLTTKQKIDIYIYIKIWPSLQSIWIFHISSTWDWLHHFSQVFSMFEKKRVFKIFKSWQVCGWLTKWFIMLGFKDLRQPRVYWRSNVGLVLIMLNYDIEP